MSRCRIAIALCVTLVFAGCGGKPSDSLQELTPGLSVAGGETGCWIWVAGDCHGWVPALTWFSDNYNDSPNNNGACLHRAREYAQWCGLGSPDDQVNAAFNIGGVTINAQAFKPGFDFGNVDPRVTNYGMNWAPVITSPAETFVMGPQEPATSRFNDVWTMRP